MNLVERIRQVYWKRKSARKALALAKSAINRIEHASQIRQKGNTEPRQRYQKPGHGLFFCLHERSYFTECVACRRSRSEADENERAFRQKVNP